MPDGLVPEEVTAADLRLVRKALRHNWPISDDLRARLVNRMDDLLGSEDERNAIAAAKTLVMADAINAKRENADKPKEQTDGMTFNGPVQINGQSLDISQILASHSAAIAAAARREIDYRRDTEPFESDDLQQPVHPGRGDEAEPETA